LIKEQIMEMKRPPGDDDWGSFQYGPVKSGNEVNGQCGVLI